MFQKLFFHEIHIILLVYKALVGRNILWQQQTWGSRQFSLAVTKNQQKNCAHKLVCTHVQRAQAGVHTCLARTSWCAHMFCAHKLVCTHVQRAMHNLNNSKTTGVSRLQCPLLYSNAILKRSRSAERCLRSSRFRRMFCSTMINPSGTESRSSCFLCEHKRFIFLCVLHIRI